MRNDFIQNMININRRERMRKRRNMVIFFLGLCAFAYFGLVLSLTVFKSNEGLVSGQVAVAKFESESVKKASETKGVTVTVSEPKATVKPAATPTYRPAGKITRSSSQPTPAVTQTPEHTWKSTSNSAVKVHTTSSATVQHVGGGGVSTGARTSGTTVTTPSSAFGVSTSIMVVPTLARVSSRSLTADNTRAAEAEVLESTAQGRAAKPGIRRVDGDDDPLGPMEDPIGDGLWTLLFLVVAYGAVMFYRRKQRV